MPTRLTLCFFTFLLFLVSAHGEQAIYESVGRQTLYGNGRMTKLVAKGFLVLEPDTYRATAIVGFTLNGMKLFSVVALENYRVENVTGANGSTYTIMAKAESPGTQFQGVLLEAVYLRGKNNPVALGGATTHSLPRTFISSARTIVRNEQTGITVAGEVSGSYTLDVNASRASNLSETFESAVGRLTNYFIARGYTQFSAPPAPETP